jgi:hypothetical protein
MLILPTKDPDEVLNYTFDWSDRLGTDTLSGADRDGHRRGARTASRTRQPR